MSVHDNRIKVTRKQDHQGRKVRLDLVRSNRWWVTERRQFTITEYQMLRTRSRRTFRPW